MTPANLDADLDPILTALGNAAGEPTLINDVAGVLDNLLGTSSTAGQIPKLITELEQL